MIKKNTPGQLRLNSSKTPRFSFFSPPERHLKNPNLASEAELTQNSQKIPPAEQIKILKENLSKSENEIERKEVEINRLKEYYEKELASLKDYIDLIKKPGHEAIEEQLKNEKARSMTFFRALTRKKQECDQTKESLAKVKELETQITVLEDQLEKMRLAEKKQETAHKAVHCFQIDPNFSDFQETIKRLKASINEKMNESISKAVANFSIFNSKISKLSDKQASLEKKQAEFQTTSEKIKHLEKSLESSVKDNLEFQKTIEKNYKQLAGFEEEVKKQKKKIKELSQENKENKQGYEGKIRKLLTELSEFKEKYLNLEDRKKNEKSPGFAVTEEHELIIQQLNRENAKIMEDLQVCKKKIKLLTDENQEKNIENSKLKLNIENNEKVVIDLRNSLRNVQNELKSFTQKKDSTENKDFIETKTKDFLLEKCLSFSIVGSTEKKNLEPNTFVSENQAGLDPNNLLTETSLLNKEKQPNSDLVKSLQDQVQKLKSEKLEVEEDLSRVFKELKIANEVIFHNHKILDTSCSFTAYDSERETHPEQHKFLKKIEDLTLDLEAEKKQHEQSVKNLIESDKRIEILLLNLDQSKDSILKKEAKIQETQEKLNSLNSKYLDLKVIFQSKLNQFEDLQAQYTEKLKENDLNLALIEKLEQKLQENEDLLEYKTANIEELQEAVEQFKQEISETKKTLKIKEKELEMSKQDLEFRNKINDLSRIAKDQDSVSLTVYEESSSEAEETNKQRAVEEILNELIITEKNGQKIELFDRLKEKIINFKSSQPAESKLKIREKNKGLEFKSSRLSGDLNFSQEKKSEDFQKESGNGLADKPDANKGNIFIQDISEELASYCSEDVSNYQS